MVVTVYLISNPKALYATIADSSSGRFSFFHSAQCVEFSCVLHNRQILGNLSNKHFPFLDTLKYADSWKNMFTIGVDNSDDPCTQKYPGGQS